MSDVKIMWTAQGMMLADVIGESSDAYELENPVYVQVTQQGAQLYPFLSMVTETTQIEVRKSELLFNALQAEPFPALRDAHRDMFGKIQLITK